MSVEATPAQVRAIESLAFVDRVEVVRRFRQRREVVDARAASGEAAEPLRKASTLDYGTSFGQVNQIKVPFLHDVGLDGRGVVIAVLDAGFDNLPHTAFATTRIVATRDFVNGDERVADGDVGEGSHGTATLSVLGGFHPGQIIGPAYAASFILAKTENTESETPVERTTGRPRSSGRSPWARTWSAAPSGISPTTARSPATPPPTWTGTPRSARGPRTSPASGA